MQYRGTKGVISTEEELLKLKQYFLLPKTMSGITLTRLFVIF